tara:strand:+ start:2782 stop:3825 length:1044 start_codon:yes stop_codon:yes gene_type:complete
MKKLISTTLFTAILLLNANSQILFFEDFQDEVNNSTSGTDSTGVNWSTSAPFASTGFFKVRNNRLVAKHTRGQAKFETGDISVSCIDDVIVNIDLKENGSLEENGCIADYTKFQYSWDGGATWESIGDPVYGTVNNDILETGCNNEVDTIRGPFLTLGDFPVHVASICIPATGTSLRVRLIVKTYWVDEKHIIDNVRIECGDCDASLPVEMTYFDGYSVEYKTYLMWETATEINNSGFEVYSSNDGESWSYLSFVNGNGNSTNINRYEFIDNYNSGQYYRLKQIDYDGQFEYSDIISVNSDNESNIKIEYYSVLGEKFNNEPNLSIYIKTIYNENTIINSSFVRRNN